MNHTVEYKDPEDMYLDYDLDGHSSVTAEYGKAINPEDGGNILIEALPRPLTGKKVRQTYNQPLLHYNRNEALALTIPERKIALSSLRSVRLYLPFHDRLEEEFYKTLIRGYRQRKIHRSSRAFRKVYEQDEEKEISAASEGCAESGTMDGMNLLGYSGCGKSSALGILLSHYPQVIRHDLGDGNTLTQIVYICANCPPNSNFSALFQLLARAVDRALGNYSAYYENEMRKKIQVGKMALYMTELIETFSIGTIILDEIQLLDFSGTKQNTFENLLTISNTTKVPIMVIGTEEAKQKMFSAPRMGRRAGAEITGSTYCGSKQYARVLLSHLLSYQWTDDPIPDPGKDQEFFEAFYEETHGVIDQMVRLSEFLQADWLSRKPSKRPVIDAGYVHDVSHKYFADLLPLLSRIRSTEDEVAAQKRIKEAEALLKQQDDTENQEYKMLSAVSSWDDDEEYVRLKNGAVDTICLVNGDFSRNAVTKEVEKILDKKGTAGTDLQTLVREALSVLSKKKQPKKRNPARGISPKANVKEINIGASLKTFLDPSLDAEEN